jgi:phasin
MTMANDPNNPFNIPTDMKAFTEQSMEQARKAFEGFIGSAQQAVSTFQGQAVAAQSGAKDVGQKVMTFAERNVSASLDFAQRLVQAKDVNEVVRLQSEYVSGQMQALTEQAKELGESASQAMRQGGRPKS